MPTGRRPIQEIVEMPTFGQDLVASATEAVAIARGEKEPAKTIAVEVVDVAAIRKKLQIWLLASAEGMSYAFSFFITP